MCVCPTDIAIKAANLLFLQASMGYRPGEGLGRSGMGITAPITEGGRMEKELQEYSSVSKRIMVCVCVYESVCQSEYRCVCVSHRYSQPVKQLICSFFRHPWGTDQGKA